MHFYRVPRCTRRSQCGPGLWIGSKCQWYRRNAQFSVSRGLVQALALPLPWQSLGERLVSCERGTIIGRHHQLPAGQSGAPGSALASRWGCAHMGWSPRPHLLDILRPARPSLLSGQTTLRRPEAASARSGPPGTTPPDPASRPARGGARLPQPGRSSPPLTRLRNGPPAPGQRPSRASPWWPLCLGVVSCCFLAPRPPAQGRPAGQRSRERARA